MAVASIAPRPRQVDGPSTSAPTSPVRLNDTVPVPTNPASTAGSVTTWSSSAVASTPKANEAFGARFDDAVSIAVAVAPEPPGPAADAVTSRVTVVAFAAGVRLVTSTSALASTATVIVT